MILVELEAINFGKFRRLALRDIPHHGLIGVVGPNESGKTTIGDAVCFSLFGRTAGQRVPEEHINWQHDDMSLRLDFLDVEGVPWRVEREVDRSGTYAARLIRRDSSEEVRGVGRVEAKVEEILRLDFRSFVYAFYLAQKELDRTRHHATGSKRHVVDELTGVSVIERATDTVSDELENLIERRTALMEDATVARRLLEEYGGNRQQDDADESSANLDEVIAREAELQSSLATTVEALERSRTLCSSADRVRNYLASLKARTYAYVLGGRRAWLSALEENLERQLAAAEKERSSCTESTARREAFRRKLGELAGLVHMRQNQIARALENRLPENVSADEEDLLTPDGKVEQLVLTRLRMRREIEREQERLRDLRWLIGGLVIVFVVTVACHVWSAVLGSHIPFVVGIAGTVMLAVGTWRQMGLVRLARQRHARMVETASRLEKDVAALKEALKLCDEFDVGRLEGLDERLTRMGGGMLSEFYHGLAAEYGDYLGVSSAELVKNSRRADRLDSRLAELHEDLSEVRHAAQDLDMWLGRFSDSPFFKSSSSQPFPEAVFERASFRATMKTLAREIEGCQRTLFLLENECRSLVSPRICSSWRDFEEVLQTIEGHQGAPHKINLEPLRAIARDEFVEDGDPLDGIKKAEGRLTSWCPRRDNVSAEIESLQNTLQEAREELSHIRMQRVTMEERLARVEPDAARCRQLEDDLQRIDADSDDVNRRIRVREILLELLTGLSERMRQRLGPALADWISFVLPRMTGDRYREVRLTDDVELQVWSPEKEDYVGLDALSGGTVDQLLVSLRLAFAKALMDTAMPEEEHQFLFFDEPLASFDRERAESFLGLLRTFGGAFGQVFLVSHLRDLEELFDATVETLIDMDELDVSLGGLIESFEAGESDEPSPIS